MIIFAWGSTPAIQIWDVTPLFELGSKMCSAGASKEVPLKLEK